MARGLPELGGGVDGFGWPGAGRSLQACQVAEEPQFEEVGQAKIPRGRAPLAGGAANVDACGRSTGREAWSRWKAAGWVPWGRAVSGARPAGGPQRPWQSAEARAGQVAAEAAITDSFCERFYSEGKKRGPGAMMSLSGFLFQVETTQHMCMALAKMH